LNADAIVVTNPSDVLKSGQKVKILDTPAPEKTGKP
jgi:hypothetical protein